MAATEALIFAGGVGRRMGSGPRPKQFLELSGRPIIDYTIEKFALHDQITRVVVSCLPSWIEWLKNYLATKRYPIAVDVVGGGATGQESIFNGLDELRRAHPGEGDAIVLVHDGVRPIINAETISACVKSVRERGCTATVAPAIETIVVTGDDDSVSDIIPRSQVSLARAPQAFLTEELYAAHLRSKRDCMEFIDSVSMMSYYGHRIYTINGPAENIKVTTPMDYFAFRGYMDECDQRLLWSKGEDEG